MKKLFKSKKIILIAAAVLICALIIGAFIRSSNSDELITDFANQIYGGKSVASGSGVVVVSGSALAIKEVTRVRPLRVLELQPTNLSYKLTKPMLAKAYGLLEDQITLEQLPITLFIAQVEPITGKYDIIFFGAGDGTQQIARGNRGSHNITYSNRYIATRKIITTLENNNSEEYRTDYKKKYAFYSNLLATDIRKQGISADYPEYISGIDITRQKAKLVEEFIRAGQPIVFEKEIFETTAQEQKDTIMYKQFLSYYQDKDVYKNLLFVSGLDDEEDQKLYKKQLEEHSLRPFLQATSKVTDDRTSSGDYIMTHQYSTYNLLGQERRLDAKLYLDLNADGIYEEGELFNSDVQVIESKKFEQTGDGSLTDTYTQNYMYTSIPGEYKGRLAWRLVITDFDTKTDSYIQGAEEIFGGTAISIKVLQIRPNQKNSFNLKTDIDHLLDGIQSKYSFNTEVITIRQWEMRYAANSAYSLNDHYDMVVLGFGDTYSGNTPGNHITSESAINDLKNFIDSGKGVMFTHDTITYPEMNSALFLETFRPYVAQVKSVPAADEATGIAAYDNLEPYNYSLSARAFQFHTTKTVHKINSGQLADYPIANVESFHVSPTHYQYYELDLEDPEVVVWYTIGEANNDYMDPRNYYYTYSKGNITFSGTGHSGSGYTEEEKKMFVNTIVRAASSANHSPRVSFSGQQKLAKAKKTYTFGIKAQDIDANDSILKSIEVRVYNGTDTSAEVIKTFQGGSLADVKRGTIISLTLDETDLAKITGNNFTLQAYAQDMQGAKSESVTMTVERVDVPYILDQGLQKGYLVGDTLSLTSNLELHFANEKYDPIGEIIDTKIETAIIGTDGKSIPLVNGTIFEIQDLVNYKISNNFFVPKEVINDIRPTGVDRRETTAFTANVEAKRAGRYQLQSILTYRNRFAGATQYNNELQKEVSEFEIRLSQLDIIVNNTNGQPMPHAKISVRNRKGDIVDLSNYRSNGLTDARGKVSISGLPTDLYTILVDETDAYGSVSTNVALSYDSHEKEVVLAVNLVPVEETTLQVSLTENDGYVEQLQITGTTRMVYLKFSFKNNRAFAYEEFFFLDNPGMGFTYTLQSVHKKGTTNSISGFTFLDKKLKYDAATRLPLGEYEAIIRITLPSATTAYSNAHVTLGPNAQAPTAKWRAQRGGELFTYAVQSASIRIIKDDIAPIITVQKTPRHTVYIPAIGASDKFVSLILKLDGTGSDAIAAKYAKGSYTLNEFKALPSAETVTIPLSTGIPTTNTILYHQNVYKNTFDGVSQAVINTQFRNIYSGSTAKLTYQDGKVIVNNGTGDELHMDTASPVMKDGFASVEITPLQWKSGLLFRAVDQNNFSWVGFELNSAGKLCLRIREKISGVSKDIYPVLLPEVFNPGDTFLLSVYFQGNDLFIRANDVVLYHGVRPHTDKLGASAKPTIAGRIGVMGWSESKNTSFDHLEAREFDATLWKGAPLANGYQLLDDESNFIRWAKPNDLQIKENGSYTFYMKDEGGNETVVTYKVDNIVKLLPNLN